MAVWRQLSLHRGFSYFNPHLSVNIITWTCHSRTASSKNPKPPWKIMFFGSDSFAIKSLQLLTSKLRTNTLIQDLQVTTNFAVDWNNKPNAVFQFAKKEKLPLHEWPVCSEDVYQKFDLGIVVSFGYLIPPEIIDCFPLSILNIHGSLLPKLRGAAPIMRAIMNGDSETGVTIMKIDPYKFDTGSIVTQHVVPILSNETTPELTDRLANIGALLLMECIRNLPRCIENSVPQSSDGATFAKKVTKSSAIVKWSKNTADDVFNLFRAINHIHPLTTCWFGKTIKLLNVVKDNMLDFNPENSRNIKELRINCGELSGLVEYSKQRQTIRILCKDGRWVCVNNVLVSGFKTMSAAEFNNGFVSKVKNSLERRFTVPHEYNRERLLS